MEIENLAKINLLFLTIRDDSLDMHPILEAKGDEITWFD